MEFVAATNNRHKLEELARLLAGSGHSVVSMGSAGVQVNPAENGDTFEANAIIKAKAVAAAAGRPALADDSGLEVDALAGAPGVRSARFAGEEATDEENNKKLLHLLERTPYAKRTARFVSVLALAAPGGQVLLGEGRCEGLVGLAPSGEGGFGYDPLFYVNNRSFADMTGEEKDAVSHRARAVKDFLAKLPDFLAQNNL